MQNPTSGYSGLLNKTLYLNAGVEVFEMKDPAPALLPSSPVLALGNNIIKMKYDLSYFTLKYKIAFRSLSRPTSEYSWQKTRGKRSGKSRKVVKEVERSSRSCISLLPMRSSCLDLLQLQQLSDYICLLIMEWGQTCINQKKIIWRANWLNRKYIFFFNVSWQQKSLPSQRTKYFRFQLL